VSRRLDSGFLVDASNNDVSISLPDASLTKKQVYFFKRKDNCKYAVKINPVNGQTVDGQTCVYVQAYENLRIMSDGENWYVI